MYFVWIQESRLYKKIYSSANPLLKNHNGRLMNNKDCANTQNSTIHPENNVYRYKKAKKLVTSTYVFENIMHKHPFGMNYMQFYFFCKHCFFIWAHNTFPFFSTW